MVEHRTASDGVEANLRVAFHEPKQTDPQTLRTLALEHLRRLVAQLEEGEWERHSLLSGGAMKKGRGPVEGPFHVPASQKRPPRPGFRWETPELPAKDVRTCHEILEALLLLGVHGRAVPVGDLHRVRGIPQQRLYKALDPDSPTYAYLERFIRDLKSHGKRLLDLTAEGRQLASMIRSGEVKA